MRGHTFSRLGLPALVVLLVPAVLFGCAQIIGADESFGLTEPALSGGDSGTLADVVFVDVGDAIAVVPEAGDPNACPASEKRCNGACVSKTLPEYGCGAGACSPCSLPHTLVHKCSADPTPVCERGSCRQGWRACGSLSSGCTSDLSSTDTCGTCEDSCQAAQVCNPTGCGATCDVGLTLCGSSCVDTLVSELHCGLTTDANACSTVCPGTANGDPVCSAGVCSVACRPGFAHCISGDNVTCTQQQLFYVDSDGDGYGDITKPPKLACPGAAPVGLSAIAGDCHDGIKEVNPGQQQYFPQPYKTVTNGDLTYDWNCDGVESERLGVVHFAPCRDDCNGSGLGPAGSSRKGPGVNDYCGSTVLFGCTRQMAEPLMPAAVPVNPKIVQPFAEELENPACGVTRRETGQNGCR